MIPLCFIFINPRFESYIDTLVPDRCRRWCGLGGRTLCPSDASRRGLRWEFMEKGGESSCKTKCFRGGACGGSFASSEWVGSKKKDHYGWPIYLTFHVLWIEFQFKTLFLHSAKPEVATNEFLNFSGDGVSNLLIFFLHRIILDNILKIITLLRFTTPPTKPV
jgi:hypothetical protein